MILQAVLERKRLRLLSHTELEGKDKEGETVTGRSRIFSQTVQDAK
jgi:hypothetical protein